MAGDGVRRTLREVAGLERDVLVLSVAMLAFSLSYQMTDRYVAAYMQALGAGAGVIGIFGSFKQFIAAIYPYPGGAISDRIGTRRALTLFGLLSVVGFVVWLAAPGLGGPLPAWAWLFVGLVLVQAWNSLGLGATFALVKQSVDAAHLARGFAATEVVRRVGFLLGPLFATAIFALTAGFLDGFQFVLVVAIGFAVVATVAQRLLYDPIGDTLGKAWAGLASVREDLAALPRPLRPLLVADTLVRFANGMVYVFFVLVVVDRLQVSATLPVVGLLRPEAYFGVLLAVEMVVALLVMLPSAWVADNWGLKPVVAAGFSVYALTPILLISAPPEALVVALVFAFSGLRFAGLPAHKALIVGPAEKGAGGRVTGAYYLLRNALTVPGAAVGGFLYAQSPTIAFTVATVVGLVGTLVFVVFGVEPTT
ncbi:MULTISPECIES: MFS transporter [unclassified Haladaptatus]|uniref:MFS transporter n=1 Tax=unclassified Haladaptatus TaxID=2622732 RepID=UPI0023E77A35|nr:MULTISPECIES: MFS transporter [unclassified Haladaptatus]